MVAIARTVRIAKWPGDNTPGRDILDLVALIQDKVFAAYQVKLELEQRII